MITLRRSALAFGLTWLCLCAVGAGCGERRVALGTGGARGGVAGGFGGAGGAGGDPSFQVVTVGKADILFVVDDAPSMKPFQQRLARAFPALLDQMRAGPNGGPDVRVAVTSADMGAGKFDLPQHNCPLRGDAGQFQTAPRGDCTVSPLQPSQHFLQAGNSRANYAGSAADAFTCIAPLGEAGCLFGSPLEAAWFALWPSGLPGQNLGFLRPGATLAVVLLTNSDDCSLPGDSQLGDPSQWRMSDQLGPFTSFRCNEFGHLCNIEGRLQSPPRGPADQLLDCTTNDTPTSRLSSVDEEIFFLKDVTPEPNRMVVMAIAGPPTPYGIQMVQGAGDIEPHPMMKPSCTTWSGESAEPAIRIQKWVDAFGSHGMMRSICDDDMAPAMRDLGASIERLTSSYCVHGPFPVDAGASPACRVLDSVLIDGFSEPQPLPACDASGGVAPCWSLVDDLARCLPGDKLLRIERGDTLAPESTIFTCAPCPTGARAPGC